MRTKVSPFILIVVLILSACAAPAAPTAAPKSAAPAQPSGTPIKIGMITPLTGAAALDGKYTSNGAKLAVAEINAAGGVLGRPIEFLLEDGKADPTESTNAAEKLMTRDKVSVLMGAWASSATLAVMPLVEKYQIPFVVEISTNPIITNPGNKWTFRTCSNETLNSTFVGATAVKNLGFKNVAILAVNNDWGRGAAESYKKIFEGAGAKVVSIEYSDAAEVNFYPILNKIKASTADSLLVTHSLQTMVNVFKQMRELNMQHKALSTGGYTLDAMKKAAGGDASIYEGAYSLAYTIPAGIESVPKVKQFSDAYAKAYPGEALDRGAGNGYDAVYVIADAIKIANSTDPAKIRDALEKVKYDGVGGHLEFDAQHQAKPTLYITQFKDGKQVILTF